MYQITCVFCIVNVADLSNLHLHPAPALYFLGRTDMGVYKPRLQPHLSWWNLYHVYAYSLYCIIHHVNKVLLYSKVLFYSILTDWLTGCSRFNHHERPIFFSASATSNPRFSLDLVGEHSALVFLLFGAVYWSFNVALVNYFHIVAVAVIVICYIPLDWCRSPIDSMSALVTVCQQWFRK